ncbi:hypothetical protein BDFB_006603 [Asbolus verrucosus]|uniref:Uncharacterized protein n=1 Tax=Asbolus verrucosus TaxID=1661398 RepID=A0A482VT36_ASBVE|nr:hypothetical protein BDFB_006603 [Asbolus verrucosus]
MSFHYNHRLPRCVSNYQLDNNTIHLVHSAHKWTPKQIKLVENITHFFPNHTINLLVIKDQFNLNETVKYIPAATLKRVTPRHVQEIKPFAELQARHPNIHVTYITYQSIFEKTPLFLNWPYLNEQMKIFAARVLQMWQFGGLSFDLLEFRIPQPKRFQNETDYAERKLKKFLRRGLEKFEKLSPEMVSVDRNGLHMEAKTPCHAFFDNVFMKLRRAHQKSTPRSVLTGALYTFCADGVIDSDFCQNRNIILF